MTAASESLCCTLLLFVCVFADEKIITAESGQKVILPCQALNTIIGVEWSRPDLNEEYVLLHRDGHFDPGSQHPSFKNRVDLQDRQMKDGDVSLILKDVTTADSGTYECRIRESKSRGILEGGPNSIIYLSVVDPPDEKIITAESGQKVILPCQALNTIIGVEWSRPDLNEEYVLLHRDGHFDPGSQHPSFKNRVDLQDRQMKDGDVSLILKDVTTADSGTYECRIRESKSRGILEGGPISIVSLTVDPPGQLIIRRVSMGEKINAPFGLIVAHSVSAVLLVAGL